MVRSKGSPENLGLALAFANAVTRNIDDAADHVYLVDKKGNAAIYLLMIRCLPHLGQNQSRDSLSEIEFNKHLQKNGYVPYRKRNRIKGTVDQWQKGTYRWRNRRWIDPWSHGDISYLSHRLTEFSRYDACVEIKSVLNLLVEMHLTDSSGSCSKIKSDGVVTNAISNQVIRYCTAYHRISLLESRLTLCPILRRIPSFVASLAVSFYQVEIPKFLPADPTCGSGLTSRSMHLLCALVCLDLVVCLTKNR